MITILSFLLFGLLLGMNKCEETQQCTLQDDTISVYCYHLKLESGETIKLDKLTGNEESLHLGYCSGVIDETSLSNMRNLKSISISNCNLDKLVLPVLEKLDYIRIHNSTIPKITKNTLKNAKNLTGVNFAYNNGLEIEEGAFKGLPLEQISIVHEKIAPTKGLFEGLVNLKELRMTNANINRIYADTFENSPGITDLILDDNDIVSLCLKSLKPLKDLEYLSLLNTKIGPLRVEQFSENKKLVNLGVPARSLKDLNLEKLLQVCPKLSAITLLTSDMKCQECKDLLQQITTGNVMMGVAYVEDFGRPSSC